jgi:hypothetical protein
MRPCAPTWLWAKRVEARFDRHDREDQRRVDLRALADAVGLGHQHAQRLGGHAVLLAKPVGHGGLLLGQVGGARGRGALDGGRLQVGGFGRGLARLQPAHQLLLAGLAQVRARHEGECREHDGQADQRKPVVGDFKKAVCHVGDEGLEPSARGIERLVHRSSFLCGTRLATPWRRWMKAAALGLVRIRLRAME